MIKFLKTTAVYFLGNVLTKVISFLLLPIYTSALLPAELGSYDLINSIVSLIIPIAFFQIWDSIFRFSFDSNKKNDKDDIVANGYIVFLACLVLYTIVYFILNMFIDINNKYLVYLFSISVGFQFLYGYISRAYLKNFLFVSSGVLNSIINIGLNIILIKIFSIGVESLFISQFLGNFIQSVVIHVNIDKISFCNVKKKKILEMIKFSLPLSISTVSYWLLSGFTQVYISMTLGMTYNGYLSIANRFSNIIVLGVSMIQYAWNETSYIAINSDNNNSFYEKAINYMVVSLFFLISICLIGIKLIFPYLVAEQYNYSMIIIPISLIGIAFNSCASFIGTIFMSHKNSIDVVKSTIISAMVNICLIVVLSEKFKLVGAISSLCISFFINYLIRTIILKKKYNILINVKNYMYFLLTILSVLIYYTINNVALLIIYLIITIGILLLINKKLVIRFLTKLRGCNL